MRGAIVIGAIVTVDNGVSFVLGNAVSTAVRITTCSSVGRCYMLGGIYVTINTRLVITDNSLVKYY